jgi:hypothetical protein
MSDQFAYTGDFHVNVGIFYMLQIRDMKQTSFTSPLKEGMLWIFSP